MTAPANFGERLLRAAADRELLDAADIALVRVLLREAGNGPDGTLVAVAAALLRTTQEGGLRIPLSPAALEACVKALIVDAFAPAEAAPASAQSVGTPAAESSNPPVTSPGEQARILAARFLERLKAGNYGRIVGQGGDFRPLISASDSLYFQKYHAAETSVGARLSALLSAPDAEIPSDTARDLLARSAEGAGVELNPAQKTALALGLRRRLLIVSGGPGTGKTTLIAGLLRAWSSLRGPEARIRLAAPTGKAAQRLTESLRRNLSGAGEPLASLECETLHRLLRWHRVTGDYLHGPGRPLDAALVIIDEVSMVDVVAMAALLEALPPDASLALLGDMDQLPSVESGAVLADLIPVTTVPGFSPPLRAWLSEALPGVDLPPANPETTPLQDGLVILDRSHRSEEGILSVARNVNAGDAEAARRKMGEAVPLRGAPFEEAGCRMLERPRGRAAQSVSAQGAAPEDVSAEWRKGWDQWLDRWTEDIFLSSDAGGLGFGERADRLGSSGLGASLSDPTALPWTLSLSAVPGEDPARAAWREDLTALFARLDAGRILAFTRKGWHGAEHANRRIGARLSLRWDPRRPQGQAAFHGSPILILENDSARGLSNGETGLVLRVGSRYSAFFRKAGLIQAHSLGFLPRHEPAFAMTVHKSQGSEYDRILIVLPEGGNRLLFKETLYTGLTRARRFAGIYGSAEVFAEAVGKKVVRDSGLRALIRGPAAGIP